MSSLHKGCPLAGQCPATDGKASAPGVFTATDRGRIARYLADLETSGDRGWVDR